MFYFTIQKEMNAIDLVQELKGYGDETTDKILELTEEYQLEESLLDLVDINIGENVELYEITDDIKENVGEYIEHLKENIDEDLLEDFEETIQDLGL